MPPLDLGIVSDEISQDFQEALQYGRQWGIRIFEIRCLKSGRVPDVDPEEFRAVLDLVRKHQVTVTALSPGIFKHPLSEHQALERELSETLPKTLEMAGQLGARLVIVFGFQRQPNEPEERRDVALDFLRRAAERAEREGMKLAIENEPGFWCDSGKNTARMIRDVGSRALGANWDPCNGYGTDELPFPDGYRAVRDVTLNVHVKDTLEGALIKCVPVGEGVIDWRGQLEDIVREKIVGHVTIETHCLPLIEKSRQNVETLRRYLREIEAKPKVGV